MDLKLKTNSYSIPSRPSPLEQMREITGTLLLSDNHKELNHAVLKLHSLLSGISGINDDTVDSSDSLSTALPFGEALSPINAARCVSDAARTLKFFRGIYAAWLEAQQRFTNDVIEILYAGCGPFATLVMPLATQFKADQIQITLLDIHARSLGSAQHVIETLRLSNYIRDYIQSDAASYVHPRPLHMVITETMQKALSKEPQVAITLNLAPQLCRDGIFIPERVTIDAYLCDPHKEYMVGSRGRKGAQGVAPRVQEDRIKLGRVFELTAEKAIEVTRARGNRSYDAQAKLSAEARNLPKEIAERLKLMLATTITVFDRIVIGEYESGLTHPLWFYDFSGANGGDRIEFEYDFGSSPGFNWQIPSTR
ncbi:MAG TPA: hypothetical protein VJ875_04865 [Pyrinomonadaceae bacterium]|nr:hypothetical protein [Pyrinomonadaceae bacterium]